MPFHKVTALADLPPGSARCIEVNGRRIAVFNVGGTLHAVDDLCTHADASLAEGEVQGNEVVCPLHFATFDLTTGACTGPPASEDVCTYTVRVEGEDVEVEV